VRRLIVLSCILASVVSGLAACTSGSQVTPATECLPLTPTLQHGNLIVPGVLGGVAYARAGEGRPEPLLMDLYTPPDADGAPMVVVVHGGSWTTGSRVAHIGQLLELLTEAGFAWAAIDYRLNGLAGWQEAVADVQEAVAFVRCHAASLRIDPARIVLAGEDAGAHLAAHAAAAVRPRGLVLIGAPYDLTAIDTEATRDVDPAVRRRASLGPADHVPIGSDVPVYVLHGGADREVPASQADSFCTAVQRAGGRCDLDIVDGASHRFENWWPSQWGYKDRLIRWLRETAGPVTPRPFAPVALDGALAPGLHKRIVFDPGHGLTLDAFVPEGDGPHVPVILVHGGGWEAGDRVTYITPLFRPLAEAGFAWFSIDYRLTPSVRHEAQMEDLRTAIAFVRRHAGLLNVDPDRIVLVGESASGQMVALAAVEDQALAGVVSFYAVYDFEGFAADSPRAIPARLFGIRAPLSDRDRATLRRYSPLHRATREQAPVLLVNGTGESLWAQAQTYAARLASLGAAHDLVVLEGAPHGMENWEGHPEWTHYTSRVIDWIRQATRDGRKSAR